MSPRPRKPGRKDLPPWFRARRNGRGYYLEHPITRECATLGDDKAQALAIYWELRPEIDRQVAAQREGKRAEALVRVIEARPRGETLRAFLARWRTQILPTLTRRGSRDALAPKTAGDYERMLRRQIEPLEACAIDLARADAQAMRTLLAPWLEQPHQYNYLRACLTRALQYAVDSGTLGTNPMRAIEARAKPKRRTYVTDVEYCAITDRMPEYARRACDLLYLSGMRPADALSLRPSSLQRVEGQLAVAFAARKTGTEQELISNEDMSATLEWWAAWRQQHAPLSPFLLVHPRDASRKIASRPIKVEWLSRQWTSAARAAGLAQYQLRDLRPKSITDEILAGNPDNKGGHSEAMRKHYQRIRLPNRSTVTVNIPRRQHG